MESSGEAMSTAWKVEYDKMSMPAHLDGEVEGPGEEDEKSDDTAGGGEAGTSKDNE
jgi:hypothetical protein